MSFSCSSTPKHRLSRQLQLAGMKRPDGRKTAVILIVAAELLAPVLYVLSIRPACYLFKAGWISEGTLVTLYYPVVKLSRENETAGEWAAWYEELWTP